MKNLIKSLTGISCLLIVLTLNARHTINNYGIAACNENLHKQILAQHSTNINSADIRMIYQSGTTGTTGDNSKWYEIFDKLTKTDTDCTYKSTLGGGATVTVTLKNGSYVSDINGSETISYKGKVYECFDGVNPFCKKDCKAVK